MAKIKGHWLDELFGPGLTVRWDGNADIGNEQQPTLRFDESFSVADDGSQYIVGIRFISLDGNVVGDSDDNAVTSITGDESNVVAMFATGLQWDADAAATEPALIIGGDGAIELWNDAKRSVAASSTGPVLGNTTAITQVVGGLQLTRQFINTTPVTLDATTKATLLVINASTERTVNLPASPSDARVFFWVLVGGTSNITIGRNGRLINGAASNYTPANNSRGIIFSDGTDYYTFAGLA
jgi:hypothetical protein